jgi:hypothetical protein
MASFEGFTCDGEGCGKVLQRSEVTKVTTRLVGPAANGEYTKDLCADCVGKVVPRGKRLRPLRGRKPRNQVAAAVPAMA